jgi:phage RecT family recombinase
MSNLKKMDAALVAAPSVKAAIQLTFVKEMVIKNYQSITGRKDGENYFASQVFEFLSIINDKPDLQKCDRFSMMAALVKTASMGLALQDGHVDLIKYGTILKASPNYKGHRELLRRMPTIDSVGEGVVVLKGEKFVWDKQNNKVIEHIGGDEDISLKLENIRYAYVRVMFKDGTYADVVVSNEELKKAKSKSKNQGENSVWDQWPSQMAKKVPVHRAYTTYYKRPEVSPELELGEFAKDDDETNDIPYSEEKIPEPEQPKEPEAATDSTPVATARVVKTSSKVDEFLDNKR